MSIRLVRKDEVKTLQELNDEVFTDNSKYDTDLKLDWATSDTGRKYFTKVLENPEAICLIAEENTKPIGYLVAVPKKFGHRLSTYIEIENMGVSPNSRSQGIGTQLVTACLKMAKERGYQKVYVSAYIENTKAISFYEKCGLGKIDVSLEKII